MTDLLDHRLCQYIDLALFESRFCVFDQLLAEHR